uniref:Rhodanese domain protein n=1 Tax=Cereibacter sphaeroides (strain ATCC 17025 / ATH 2.4.3) TaxID=349102 RepID=A4WQI6_CERS5
MSVVTTMLFPVIDIPREGVKRVHNLIRGVRDVSPREAYRLIAAGAAILDVREPAEFAAGHVEGSILLPLDTLEARVGEIEDLKQRPLVVLCHGGKRSATACAALARLGFTDTANIAGGILAWRRAGLPEVCPT